MEQLDDLDFADDLALLSHSHQQMQDKTTELQATTSSQVGLKIHEGKTKVLKIRKEGPSHVKWEQSVGGGNLHILRQHH